MTKRAKVNHRRAKVTSSNQSTSEHLQLRARNHLRQLFRGKQKLQLYKFWPLEITIGQMLSQSAFRTTSTTARLVGRRSFTSSSTQFSSPYHYPEGPRSNIPFNPLT